jgi:hypothetical protein
LDSVWANRTYFGLFKKVAFASSVKFGANENIMDALMQGANYCSVPVNLLKER